MSICWLERDNLNAEFIVDCVLDWIEIDLRWVAEIGIEIRAHNDVGVVNLVEEVGNAIGGSELRRIARIHLDCFTINDLDNLGPDATDPACNEVRDRVIAQPGALPPVEGPRIRLLC